MLTHHVEKSSFDPDGFSDHYPIALTLKERS
jgi:hypothetical protein